MLRLAWMRGQQRFRPRSDCGSLHSSAITALLRAAGIASIITGTQGGAGASWVMHASARACTGRVLAGRPAVAIASAGKEPSTARLRAAASVLHGGGLSGPDGLKVGYAIDAAKNFHRLRARHT